jgi:PAS domain S-box-containing protein
MKGPFERTVAIGAVLLAAFLIGNAVVSYRNLGHLRRDARQVTHTHEVIEGTEKILGSVRDIESAQRGYVLSRDPAFLQPCEDALERYPSQLARLRTLVADNPDQAARIERIVELIEMRIAKSRRCIDEARRGNIAAAGMIVESGEGNHLMERIRAEAEAIEQSELALLERRQVAARQAYEAASATVLASTAVGLTAVATFAVLLARHLRSRVRAAEVLHQQRELFRSTLAGIDDAVLVTDLDGRVTFLNSIAEKLTGWSATEALGRPLEEVYFTEPEQPAPSPAGSPPVTELDHRLVSRDGTHQTVEQSVNPLRDATGALTGRVVVFRDIGPRRRSETELRKLAASLAETDRRKDEFLATLAHELRNPLAPIRNGLEIIRLTGNDDAIRPVCDVMNRQLNHLVRLVDDLMDVSRIHRNKLQVRLDRVDLTSVIRTAVEATQPLIDSNQLQLTMSIPDEPVELDADHTRLAQVFSNLLNNAAKYTQPGGRIEVLVDRSASEVVIRVRDTGVGIPPEMLSRVFDMFTQIESTMERAQGGLGIGLMLVKRLVEMHGGAVEAASDGEGRGSEFTVRLPVVQARPCGDSPAALESRIRSFPVESGFR